MGPVVHIVMKHEQSAGRENMSRVRLSICATAVVLVMPVSVWAVGLGDYRAQPHPLAFAYDPGNQARTRGLDLDGAVGPTDPSSTAESGQGEDGFYDRFQNQIDTVLAPTKAVDPASDRSKWMILLIAFAGLTAATSGPRRARRATLSI
jgi:hypothetical protein